MRASISIISLMPLLLSACAAFETSESSRDASEVPLHEVTITGVAADVISAPRGARVSLYELDAKNELVALADGDTRLFDKNGVFSMSIAIPYRQPDVIARLETMNGEQRVVVSTKSEIDGAIALPPFTLESTIETEVYLQAQRMGLWRDDHVISRLRSLVTEPLTAAVIAADDNKDALWTVTSATIAAMDSWTEMMVRQGPQTSSTAERRQGVANLLAGLDTVHLLADLEEAQGRSGRIDDAERVYAFYRMAGVGDAELAAAAQATAETLEFYAAGAPDPVNKELVRIAAQHRLVHTTRYLMSTLTDLGASKSSKAEVQKVSDALLKKISTQTQRSVISLRWEPLRDATVAALGQGNVLRKTSLPLKQAAVLRSIEEAKSDIERLGRRAPPSVVTQTIVQSLSPILPDAAPAGEETRIMQALAVVELPCKSMVRYAVTMLMPTDVK